MSDENEPLAFLARSETRVAILRYLAAEGPCERSAIVERLAVSDRTVKRALSAFEERSWVRQTSPEFVLTALGETILSAYNSAVESVRVGHRLEPVIGRIRADVSDLPIDALADAELVEATESDPNAPVERALAFRRRSDRLRELSSIVTEESATQLLERVRAGELESAFVILERNVLRTIQERPEYLDSFRETVAADPVSVSIYDGQFPFLLAVSEDRATVAVTDENGFPVALVVSDSPRVYEWATDVFERYEQRAEPVSSGRLGAASTDRV